MVIKAGATKSQDVEGFVGNVSVGQVTAEDLTSLCAV